MEWPHINRRINAPPPLSGPTDRAPGRAAWLTPVVRSNASAHLSPAVVAHNKPEQVDGYMHCGSQRTRIARVGGQVG
eukprot:7388562-Prymnesium_polylepis.1